MDRSIMFPPIISPRESWGILLKAEVIPTKKLGRETPRAIRKKATTNSFQLRNLEIFDKESIRCLPQKIRKKQATMKARVWKRILIFFKSKFKNQKSK